MSREVAVKIVREKQYQFPKEYFEDFLNYHQITKQEYYKIENKWRNKDIWTKKMESGNLKLKYHNNFP